MTNHERKCLKAGAAGLARATFSRKAGAQDGPSRYERLDRIRQREARFEARERI